MSTACGLQKINQKQNGMHGLKKMIVLLMKMEAVTMTHFAHLFGKQTKGSSNLDGRKPS